MAKTDGSDVKNQLANRTNGGQVAERKPASFQAVVTAQLNNQFKAIQSLVPKHVTPERLCRIGMNAISRNPKLLECTPDTIVGSIVNCASLGLEPNLLGHAYIVPFWNNNTKHFEAQMQIGYKGALDLIRRTGDVSTITAHEVYEGDVFEYEYGLDEKLKHVPSGETDEHKITHFYACYKLKDGGSGFIVMTRQQIEKHRDSFTKSKNKQGEVFGPWKDHFTSMALKTVLIKLIKYMPISIEKEENKTILEGLNRDNSITTVKEPTATNFGDSYLETSYKETEEESTNQDTSINVDKETGEVLEGQIKIES